MQGVTLSLCVTGSGYPSVRFHGCVTGLNFEITFVLEKHMVEDDVLFTNHLERKW